MRRSRTLVEILLLFSAFFLPGYIAQGSFAPAGIAVNALMLQSIVTGIPQFLLMVWIVVVHEQTPGQSSDAAPNPAAHWGFVRMRTRDALRTVAVLAACFVVITPFVALVLAFPSDATRGLTRGYRWGLESGAQIPLAVLFGLTAGYREEFFFRSYLLGRMQSLGISIPAAVAMSTAVFCVGHSYEGLLGIAVTAALGVLLSAAWLRWRNLHVVAIAHGAYNALVLCLSLVLPRALPAAAGMHIF